ncbi:prolyl oligopeptidase family serine peptidase [Flavobacterium sp. F-65]|uniref:Prolyl oligopeptidase family serine peptidase n=1 Tax=Flavobacterium pisciphilum TaxID=2893755 RepID=A0ABS8MX46_9FLAO|nr:prolyl oligopeptidase family serine peptidase [Flavobacterium sp. F-65]MCC9073349.1 prolyl oligopeptidase family serine peptidase [Flavobacterium sp. F-65]
MKFKMYLFVSLFFVAFVSFAQKKSLTVNDYDNWKQIEKAQLSENGAYLVYEYNPGNGDGKLVIVNTKTKASDTISRGYDAQINGKSTFVSFKIKPEIAVRRKAETKKLKKEKLPVDSLGIYVFKTKEVKKYPSLKNFSQPAEGGDWLAYKTISKSVKAKDSAGVDKKSKAKIKSDTIVVIYNPILKDSLAFLNIKNFSWSKKADKLLLHSEKKKDSLIASALLYFDAGSKKTDTIFNSKGTITKIAIEDKGDKLGFLFSSDTTKIKKYQLYKGTKSLLLELKANRIKNLPENWNYSDKGNLFFSENGKRLFFGNTLFEGEKTKDTLLNKERATLDIWAWTDKELQPEQIVKNKKEQNRTYQAVYDFDSDKAVQLANKLVPDVTVLNNGDGNFILGEDEESYKKASSWTALFVKDFYKIDLNTGEQKLLVKEQNQIWFGGSQKYAVYYNRKDSIYYSINLKTNQQKPLTKGVSVAWYDERNDQPNEPSPYGIAGWDEGDKSVYIYDRYDIWKLDPESKIKPIRITKNGRETNRIYRYFQIDNEEKFIDTKKQVLLLVFEESTKKAGYVYSDFNKEKTPTVVMEGDYFFTPPKKSKNSKTIFYTKQNYQQYPDIWVTTTDFGSHEQLTKANPQQKNFKWGSVSLVEWKNNDAVTLQGLLYKPENFDPNKKYPMVVYFYELNSDTYHRHYAPQPSRSTINRTLYTSNDYFVFIPDIIYKEGLPGQSAYNCIVSGVENMIKQYPAIDEKHVALQGQSWGGYQTAYLITQTNMFAAAMAGAPVSNMTSAYGGIRWETGISRMFQYEHTQSRIGETIWGNLDAYIKNSPLFYADKVQTPLLMMHNDNDGAVPWYQGIEYFSALRRLDKPVWMLNYNGEPHNLKADSWGNRKDLSTRMKQFFDHYLKGEKAPEWMVKGRTNLEKETNKAY